MEEIDSADVLRISLLLNEIPAPSFQTTANVFPSLNYMYCMCELKLNFGKFFILGYLLVLDIIVKCFVGKTDFSIW